MFLPAPHRRTDQSARPIDTSHNCELIINVVLDALVVLEKSTLRDEEGCENDVLVGGVV